jgi:hypothetical protein
MHRPPGSLADRQNQLRDSLLRVHGPLLTGRILASALGHRSPASLRQARHRGQVDIELFTLPNRRGFFAWTLEVADWLAKTGEASPKPVRTKGEISMT